MWSVTSPRPYQVAMISSPKGEGFPPSPEGDTKTVSGIPGAVQPVDTQSSFSQVCLLGRPVPEARTEAVRHGSELLVMHRRRPDQA